MKSTSPFVLFLSVFLAIIFAGGLLLFGWQYFIREKAPKPFTIPTSSSTPARPAEPFLEQKGVLEGEVFIVTKGGQNYKLGLVPVALYSLNALKPNIDQKTKEVSAALSQLKPLSWDAAKVEIQRKGEATKGALNAYEADPQHASLEAALEQSLAAYCAYCYLVEHRDDCAGFYFVGLPQPIVATQTDSDGRFKIELPMKGQFVLAAQAQRTIGESEEHYYWLLKVSLDGSSAKTIMLSNNNLSSEGSPDSLIPTAEEAMREQFDNHELAEEKQKQAEPAPEPVVHNRANEPIVLNPHDD